MHDKGNLSRYEREKYNSLIKELHSKNIYFDSNGKELDTLPYNELKALVLNLKIKNF
ncbi:hypothetical protein [Lysinibacillus sphaericus]|uniref:hypothetical protein n=1 Tax=Lysinibacillus sphaericus TaxID=1421 RepID=UPI0018CFCE4C|nr:hypothetical protein [Lysinibacillus sphaericus]